MSRSIVLRFAATCYDCGRALPAGTTARWFGKGRVSCCGAASPSGAGFPPVRAAAPVPPRPAAPPVVTPAELGIPLAEGLSFAHVPELAKLAPSMLLLVRLVSGSRFIVPARDAQHVCACISESCRDTVRDVTRAYSPNGLESGR